MVSRREFKIASKSSLPLHVPERQGAAERADFSRYAILRRRVADKVPLCQLRRRHPKNEK